MGIPTDHGDDDGYNENESAEWQQRSLHYYSRHYSYAVIVMSKANVDLAG